MRKFFLAVFGVCAFGFTSLSVSADSLVDGSATEQLMKPYHQEIASAFAHQVRPAELGEWYDIIQTTLFMLVRRTEVFRGSMRIIIADKVEAFCMLYPDGTFQITTGLLDYIDTSLFLDAESSPRKIRHLNTDREQCFAPIAAVCVAYFALSNYVQDKSFETVITCDIVADVLLRSAGYPQGLLTLWLNRLNAIQHKNTDAQNFRHFLARAHPKQRIEQLSINKDTASNLYEDISAVLFALHNQKGMTDALQLLEHLQQIFQKSLYFHRLTALIMHQMWCSEQPQENAVLNTFFSAAVYNSGFTPDFFKEKLSTFGKNQSEHNQNSVKPQYKLYSQTKNAYKKYFDIIYEAGLASSYANLLAYSPLQHERDRVLKIADQADRFQAGETDKTVRANYAVLLRMVGKDHEKAQMLLNDCFSQDTQSALKNQTVQTLFLNTGFPIDERQVLFQYISVLTTLNETKMAEEKTQQLFALLNPEISDTAKEKPLLLRSVFIGIGVDDLLRTWKRPSSIVYNYYTERWWYRSLNCEAVIDVLEKQSSVVQLIIDHPSSLTLFGNIRTGDTRTALEAICGQPLYHSADTDVYNCQDALLQVLYGNNKIRTIIIRD